MHDYCVREINQAFCDFKEIGDERDEDALKRAVSNCTYEFIVGNGYAAILPLFARQYGRGLKILHLRHDDRDACVANLVKHCEMFPGEYLYYSDSRYAAVKRMAAFHFGEMSKARWDRLSIEDKFGWYYDKTHALVRQHLVLFDDHIEITTERLNDEPTRRAIAEFVGDSQRRRRRHLNASVIDIASFPKAQRTKMHWLMGRLNIEELANDEVYGLDYFLDKFVAWSGYQIVDLSGAEAGTAHPRRSQLILSVRQK